MFFLLNPYHKTICLLLVFNRRLKTTTHRIFKVASFLYFTFIELNKSNNDNNNKMNKIILSMGLLFIATNISAQVAIGTVTPEPSSAFDITSTTSGFLLPRMSNAERKLISNAAEGLQVYVTDYGNGSLMIFDGSNWSVFSKTTVVDDTTAPVITSTETGINLQENSGADQTIYTITATDAVGVASYAIAGNDVDAGYLLVDSGSGVVTLTAEPDYETKPSYSFTVTATDDSSNTSAATTVTFAIINVDEVVPTITSGVTGTNKAENIGAGQMIYTIAADANDGGTIASCAIAGTDAGLLSVNAGSGVVTLTADPNYETKNSYSFTVTATDAAGTSNATTVAFYITNVDEVVPTITSGTTGTNKAENSGAGQTIYTIAATANDGGTIASYAIAGTDAALLSVNAGGVVTLTADPDYENKSSYSFTVTATDAAGTSAATTVTFSITDVNEIVVEVGDSYEGGIVFYLAPSPTDLDGDGVNDTGLIYANSNYTTTKSWNSGGWCSSCSSISTSTAIGTGATNTTNIINEYPNSTASAAGFARAYNGGGFNDWFLPSTLEQEALVSYFIEKYPASGAWSDWGSIRSNNYWSSTQHDGNQAKQRSFNHNTSPQSNNKGNAVRVIPIRAF